MLSLGVLAVLPCRVAVLPEFGGDVGALAKGCGGAGHGLGHVWGAGFPGLKAGWLRYDELIE